MTVTGSRRLDWVVGLLLAGLVLAAGPRLRVYHEAPVAREAPAAIAPPAAR